MTYPNVQKALDYIHAVLSGEIIANKYIKLACQKHLDELKNSETNPDYPYFLTLPRQKRWQSLSSFYRIPRASGHQKAKKSPLSRGKSLLAACPLVGLSERRGFVVILRF